MGQNPAEKKILRIYLDGQRLPMARAGHFHIISRIREALEAKGFRVELRSNKGAERLAAATRAGFALFLMEDPLHDRALCLRMSYFFPFWRLEKTGERWNFDVAKKPFDPGEIDTDQAQDWADRWRRYLFHGKAADPTRTGPIYIALQGRLTQHRSFQTMSPVQMIAETCAAYPNTEILAGLHPGEDYSEAELEAVSQAAAKHPNFRVQTGGMEEALATCRFVVTQNSSVALMGFFFHKPAVLFAKIDFHHIGVKVSELGAEAALASAADHAPEFDKYLYWFTAKNTIKADTPDVHERIISRLKEHGFPLD